MRIHIYVVTDSKTNLSYAQLFAQACGIDIILRSKARTWAAASRGLFIKMVDGVKTTDFLRWSDVDGRDMQHSIAWAQLKNPQRCVEKLYRAYGGDVSRLVDLCRQTIVFEHVVDMVTCLEAIMSDREIVIERIKNRMDLKYDAESTAGYRSVRCLCTLVRTQIFVAPVLIRTRIVVVLVCALCASLENWSFLFLSLLLSGLCFLLLLSFSWPLFWLYFRS
jgi:hypothetical protein